LSLNGALFQITKNNARTANADGTFTPNGHGRVQGARVALPARSLPGWQVFGGYAYLNGPHPGWPARHRQRASAAPRVTCRSNTPKDSASIWTTVHVQRKPTRSAAASSMSASVMPTTKNTVQVPEYTRVDLTGAPW